jgi:hypothetical protein
MSSGSNSIRKQEGSYNILQTTVYDSRPSAYLLDKNVTKLIQLSSNVVMVDEYTPIIYTVIPGEKYILKVDVINQNDVLEINNGYGITYFSGYLTSPITLEFIAVSNVIYINNANAVSGTLTVSMAALFKFDYAQINNFHGQGRENAKWFGSKLTGAGVNINSANTVDGGPVVKITKVNPNTIVFANNQVTTVNKSISGTKTKSI